MNIGYLLFCCEYHKIFIERNKNIRLAFSRAQRTSENLNVFITRDENFYGIHRIRVHVLFLLLRASSVITNVTKRTINAMALTFSA